MKKDPFNSFNLTNVIVKLSKVQDICLDPAGSLSKMSQYYSQIVSSSKQSTVISSSHSSFSMDAIPSANLRRQKLDQQRQMVSERQKQRRQQQVSYKITKVTLETSWIYRMVHLVRE